MSVNSNASSVFSNIFTIGGNRVESSGTRGIYFRNGPTNHLFTVNSGGTFEMNSMVMNYCRLVMQEPNVGFGIQFVANAGSIVPTYIQANTGNLAILAASGAPALILHDDNSNVVMGGVNAGTGAESAYLAFGGTERGLLPPRLTTAQRLAIFNPATGLLVFDTDLNKTVQFNGSSWVEI